MYITQSNIFIFYYTTLLVFPPNAEMTLDLEANEVEVKVLTSLASVAGSSGLAELVGMVQEGEELVSHCH